MNSPIAHVRMLGVLLGLALCAGPARPLIAAADANDPDDRWMAALALDDLAHAAADGNWAALQQRTQRLILQRLSCGHLDKMQALSDLVFVLRASRYLPMADEIDPSRKFSAWLAGNRPVSRLLFRAMQDVDAPKEALEKFRALWANDVKRVQAYAELAAAFATSAPLTHYVKQPNPCSLQESFNWFTDANLTFRYDLKAMPFELSRYVADSRLSLEERRWAFGRYSGNMNLEGSYQDVKLDEGYFYHGVPKKLAKADYTLPNMVKLGGLCIDQSYYSSQVCKAMGKPAAIITSLNMAGGAHAWLASVQIRQEGEHLTIGWNTDTGRYDLQWLPTGTVVDPASGKKINISELSLLGPAALLPLERREEADAAVALAGMVVPMAAAGGAARPAEPADLQALADDFNRTLAAASGGLKAEAAQFRPTRGLDANLVEDLLAAAADLNLANHRVWETVVQSRKAGALSTAGLDRLFGFLLDRTAKDHPDYSCQVAMWIMPTYEDANRRKEVYMKAMEAYRGRLDLQGHMMIAWADDLARRGQKTLAQTGYEMVMSSKARDVTEVLVEAARREEELLLAGQRRGEAIRMYQDIFAALSRPEAAGEFTDSAFYLLGTRLAELLTDAGRAEEAAGVRRKIAPATVPASQP